MDIVVPKWGDTMEEAILLSWLKQVGDRVVQDEAVAEMETDKATGDIVALDSGILVEILVGAGEQIEPGQIIGRLTSEQG